MPAPTFQEALEQFRTAILCPLCKQLPQDVQVIMACQHSFCRDCLEKKLAKTGKCPECKVRVGQDGYILSGVQNTMSAYMAAIEELIPREIGEESSENRDHDDEEEEEGEEEADAEKEEEEMAKEKSDASSTDRSSTKRQSLESDGGREGKRAKGEGGPSVRDENEVRIVFSGMDEVALAEVQGGVRRGKAAGLAVREVREMGKEGGADEATHLVAYVDGEMCCSRTQKYLQAIIQRKIIVSKKWLMDSVKEGKWQEVDEYYVKGDSKARVTHTPERVHSLSADEPRLLEGKRILLHASLVKGKRAALLQLIEVGRGKVVTRVEKGGEGTMVVFDDAEVTQKAVQTTFRSDDKVMLYGIQGFLTCISRYRIGV